MSEDTAAESVPRRVGRYEIVGPLASGGMAEILLGRLVGPSGFQRAVVIKRILRHLARRQDFVAMFLDEARIVANIRHPNVVHVHELGHEGDELFLVMEYLEGESVAGLMRRLHANGESLDFALCAYIVAEACAGLHAAHELTDAEGNKLDVVHRDVSPHNVFVGYGGDIKLLDFGIATVAGRVAQTEAGQFKGKMEYASPEQCRGAALDRRSDLFSLGTILWELTTGMRLFKRPNPLDMARAICERPIPSPASIVKDYPKELAAIVTRCLARSRRERYQSAVELRRELLAVSRTLSTSPTLDEDLAQLMARVFAERIREKAEMLRNMERGTNIAAVPVGEADASVQIPVARADGEIEDEGTQSTTAPLPDSARSAPRSDAPRLTSTLVMSVSHAQAATGTTKSGTTTGGVATPGEFQPPPAAPPRLPRVVLAGAIGSAAIGVVLIAVSVGARIVAAHRDAVVEDATPSTAAGASGASSEQVEWPVASVPAASVPAATPTRAAEAANEETTVHVETVPPKATIFVNGTKKGVAPLDLKVAKSATPLVIEARQPGFLPAKERVVPEASQKLKMTLVPAPAGSAAPPPPPYHRFD